MNILSEKDDNPDIPKPKLLNTKKTRPSIKKRKLKLYHIVWRDAFSEEDEWHDHESIADKDYVCETFGFLIENNKKPNYITIASTLTYDGYFCSVMNIPKSMIIKKTLIKVES